MSIRKARIEDCRAIAELALMAGEGIPAWFWEQSRQGGQPIEDVGARNAASDSENFSYRNAYLALEGEDVAGMILAYRLPGTDHVESLKEYPEFIRPLIELEQCVPDSFYINMLATYPQYRGRGIGSRLMGIADRLAVDARCSLISVEVFSQNEGALRLYQRLGYSEIGRRKVIKHPSHPYDEYIVLLVKDANLQAQN